MEEWIKIRGAKEHNLKNISVDIPRNALVVMTGLSGSGKSSLAFDTIYAEGQRRYVESLSSYARQFLGQMQKPDVESIDGLSPAIAIDQKTTSRNPRSTVGTVTEIYDYLRLLYARVGQVHCPNCGRLIEQQSLDQMLERILAFPPGTKLMLAAPVVRGRKGEFQKQLLTYRKEGYVRVQIDGEMLELDQLEDDFRLDKKKKHNIDLIIDRLVLKEGLRSRLADSLETCLQSAGGLVKVLYRLPEAETEEWSEQLLSQNFACVHCQIDVGEISPRLFSFNNPFGACPECSGLGAHAEISEALVVHDPNLSLNEGAIRAPGWNFADRKSWGRAFLEALMKRYQFSADVPFKDLPKAIRQIILYGNGGEILSIDTTTTPYNRGRNYRSDFVGVIPNMTKHYHETHSDDMKALYEDYVMSTPCPACHGARLKPEALAVRLNGLNIDEYCHLPIRQALTFLDELQFSPMQQEIAAPILLELRNRLGFLVEVGLDYLDLARASATLSGGEAQRIRLATQIGSGLTGVLYILDEPSIGLHQRDNGRLLATLKRLRDLGNTVIVVEHDEETIWEADYIVDIGPGAGEYGGEIVALGTPDEVASSSDSWTALYLSGRKSVPLPLERRQPSGWIELRNCREHNLKNLNVRIPLGVFTVLTGVSGSGKSSLMKGTLWPYLACELNGARRQSLAVDEIRGLEQLDKVIAIDQAPIGRTPRSNPATYTGVFDGIRELFAMTREAKAHGFKPGRFSFNVKGGRCEACRGDGVRKVEMHFLPDVYVPCEVCNGRRYKRETLEITYKGKNIAEVLDMTVEEALDFFKAIPKLERKLQCLMDVGLSYIRLGQPSTQLSGGEAQRIKLATELSKRATGRTIYLLDEPTTGLHTADVHRLVDILQRLTDNGNTVLVIEHNLDLIKSADYVLDLGPEGGDAGGQIVAEGSPEAVAEVERSYTGRYLKQILTRDQARRAALLD